MIKSINDTLFNGKRVLVRVDFNVPFAPNGTISDDTRISAALPTIDKIIDDGGIPVLMSHLGRPKGQKNPKYSMKPVADYMADTFGYRVIFSDDCIGSSAEKIVNGSIAGDVVVLENLRFYPEEEANDLEFAKKLKRLGDVYVNDAFGAAHRAHASCDAVARLFDERYAGNLMINEVSYLGKALTNPVKPFVAVIGGSKISGKIDVINNLLDKCNSIIIGGGMMFTFYKAQGKEIGKSILEEDKVELARDLFAKAKDKGVELLLPIDTVIADKFDNAANFRTVSIDDIDAEMMGMDIGPKTIEIFVKCIHAAKTVIWNGPMGVFEMENFAAGTKAVANALAEATKNGATTIIGGGDSAAAINQFGLEKAVSHVSTGGGASLEYLEGKILPGVEALDIH